ncbi:MAG: leucine-rich repeat domain-containing protein, partial [Clostridia bacterium]|nr:leucine-rich repeat domain-containing protein [Clostridia bacterium]
MKRVIPFLIILGAVFVLCGTSFLHTEAESFGDFVYTVSGNQATITGYNGAGGEVVIPEKINENVVVSIGNSAFKNQTSITSVSIPQYVATIDSYAFYGCTGLTSITIPKNVISIGDCAFYNCTSVTELHYDVVKELAFGGTRYDDHIEVFGNIGKFSEGVTVYVGGNVTKLPDYIFCP